MNHAVVFAFPAEAGTHLPTPEGWKAELALLGGGVNCQWPTYVAVDGQSDVAR